ncbi:MAG: hypothetical protein LBF19_05220 [Prevotellaceae bacterium]|jgi:uncharacterized protein YfaS (alpha-2-macroglobulin family)|nr:hypothetical protein [Prevotellaceae bacterium]
MKRISILSVILLLSTAFPVAAQGNYQDEWRQIDSLYRAGQPQSAQRRIDRICAEAKRQHSMPLFIKTVLYRIYMSYSWDADAVLKGIDEVEALLTTATFPAKNILHSVAADLYWRYYSSNRRQILSRTVVEGAGDSSDVRTWDLRRIVEQCIRHYRASLEDEAALQQTGLEEYRDILEKQAGSEQYRPALYDLLAFRAVEFYRENESGLVQPADRFSCADTAYFAPAATFAAKAIYTDDSLSFPFQALALLQKIIAFHLSDADPTAVVDADLQRLHFVYGVSTLPAKDSLYLAALQQLEARYAHSPAAADILFRIASLYTAQGTMYHPRQYAEAQWKYKDAMGVIETATARFPESLGAQNCLALKADIERPVLQVSIDEAVAPQTPIPALITYRNIPAAVYYKIIALDVQEEWEKSPFLTDDERVAAYAGQTAVASGTLALPDDGDYQQHVVEAALPALDMGYYVVLLSSDAHFDTSAMIITESKIWATHISYVKQTSGGQTTLLLLDRTTGHPLSGVKAQLYMREYDYDRRRNVVKSTGETYTSDTGGWIKMPSADRKYRSRYPLFTSGNDCYVGAPIYFGYAPASTPVHVSTTFFTDRAIYRPGQTVFFKGVVLKWTDGAAEIVKNHRQTITFYNVNDEKVADVAVESNTFGSFAGHFVIPATGLTGQMSIAAEKTASGRVYFHVEEYKRPKFEVVFRPIEDAYRLGAAIAVEGKAVAYAGSVASEAKVTYRVIRQARYPFWRWWQGDRPAGSPAQEITHGETITDADGAFTIPFTAMPDETIDKSLSPVFHYRIIASVSDLTGETHDAQTTIPAGYQSLLLSTDMPERINTDDRRDVTITATGLHGKPLPTQGTLTIWKLRDPKRILQPRRGEHPDRFLLPREEYERLFPHRIYDNEDSPAMMEREREMCSLTFDTGDTTVYHIPRTAQWPAGRYLMTLTAQDAFGEQVEQAVLFNTCSRKRMTMPPQTAFWFDLDKTVAQPGDVLNLTIGSAYRDVQAIVEMTGERGVLLERKTVRLSNSTQRIAVPVNETHRGNFGIAVFFVKQNCLYTQNEIIRVPYENKKLQWTFASFRDKLQPGQPEEWRITIKDKAGDAAAAELLASMYDASLDAFADNTWAFFPWKNNAIPSMWDTDDSFRADDSDELWSNYPDQAEVEQREYDRLILLRHTPVLYNKRTFATQVSSLQEEKTDANYSANALPELMGKVAGIETTSVAGVVAIEDIPLPPSPTLPPIQIRTNFNETAFFYPQLTTNEQGETVIRFTVPDALTRWNMQGIAWTADLKTGYTQKTLVTQKELMIFTNPPRFFREGDTLSFSAKLSNLSGQPLTVTTRLTFFDALTSQPLALTIDGEESPKTITVDAGGNRTQTWKLAIPEGLQAITYRITATANHPATADAASAVSDGEENVVPVLTDRILVTESLPLSVRGKQSRTYEFTKLLKNRSATLRSQAFTVEFTSHPVWNAVLSLPYIMEYPYDCIEQAFSRYYANAVASHIVRSRPRIKQVFDIWRNYQPSALSSNLEKNEELKALSLEETPWVHEARDESESRQRIAALFDDNRMDNEQATAWQKVRQAQTSNGGFAWFRGGRDDRYMTQHIVAGIGRLRKINISVKDAESLLNNAIRYIDARLAEDYDRIRQMADKAKTDYHKENHLDALTVHYLYTRSFFIGTHPIPAATHDAFDYFRTQAATYWTATANNYLKGMLALALHRYGDKRTAQNILRSLHETAVHDNETGMYWRNEPHGWWWYQAPIETHALLIEAFDEVGNNRPRVEELKIGLLKQKQTHNWKTTKATADAIYALLLTGSADATADYLLPAITVGGDTVTAPAAEAGTGYFKIAWHGGDVNADMGRITVDNPNTGIAWGAAYWQYFEQLERITPAATGVGIRKKLFVKSNSPGGSVLKEITPDKPIRVGDRVTIRLEIDVDREMEYVHLKDMRAAAFEPVNVLSGYRWQGGTGYYESTRDAATNFFIDRLPQGLYVFEYDLIATQEGAFSNGITSLQCMYAPEFTTHTEGIRIEVRSKE